ncbi:MAG: EAL domain-containing protein [Burkholderiales bacterium]|nr:EAL domain-containing protein [Burkholderiales bacterium]
MTNEDPSRQRYLESLIGNLTGWDNPRERLEQAFAQDKFLLFQQRIRPLSAEFTSRTFVEVLVRFEDEERHLTPPGEFLPVVEYFGRLPELDRWVMRSVIEWFAGHGAGRPMRFSVNADALTLADPQLPDYLAEQLERNGAGADILCFEIPEGELLARAEVLLPITRTLQQMGCRIAIGSVGRQSVSFKAIQAVSANFLKIDGALVREIGRDKATQGKVKALNRVCQLAGIETIAEFVEDQATLNLLADMGVNYAQGYGLSRPAPLAELAP